MALLVALAVVPSLFNILSGASFEPDKAAALIVLAVVALVDIVWRAISTGHSLRPSFYLSRLTHYSWALLLAGLAVWAGVVTLFSVDSVTSLWGNYDRGYGLLTLWAGIIFLGVAWDMARSGRYWLLIDAILLGAVIPILYGFVQMLNLDPVRGFGVSFPLGERASSTLGNPLYLGDYLVIVIFMGLARRILQPPSLAMARRILEIFIMAALALLALTFSRSAYLGMLAGGGALLLFWGLQEYRESRRARTAAQQENVRHSIRPKWILPAGLVVLVGGITAFVLLWPRLQHGGTIQQRLLIWQGVVAMLRHHPRAWLTGLGFDVLHFRLAPYLSPTLGHFEPDFTFRVPDRSHSLPLDLLATGGLPWLLGWMIMGGVTLWRLGRIRHPLAPWLAAIIVGRGTLLLVSFPTHVPDLLFWATLGLGLGAAHLQPTTNRESAVSARSKSLRQRGFGKGAPHIMLALAAFGVFGFSLSAAWPGGMLLWLLSVLPLLALLYALAAQVRFSLHHFVLTILVLPAILLNQHIGPTAQLAWLWLLLWMSALPIFSFWPLRDWNIAISKFAIIVLFMIPITMPRLGDIAYKSAMLTMDGTQMGEYRQDIYFTQAIRLAPYDHVMYTGMAWVLSQQLTASSDSFAARADRISRMYLGAMESQPSATKPPAELARWLAHLAKSDPRYAIQAQDAFDQALRLSPNDIQTLNDQAMFWADQGQTKKAIGELKRLLELDPLYVPTYLHLAQVYRQIGNEDAARAIIEQGRQTVPWWSGWSEQR